MNKRHVFIRPIKPTESGKFVEWSKNTVGNLFDPDVPLYPSTTVRVAYNVDGPVVYLPVQRPLFLESLAINPASSELDVASALKALTQDAVSQAHINGSGEVYFLCHLPLTSEFAERHGYEKIEVPLYRIKLNDLEPVKKP